MNDLQVFLNINLINHKINLFIVNQKNKSIFSKNLNFPNELSSEFSILDSLDLILKDLILEIETKMKLQLTKINLMVEQEYSKSIDISIRENFENKYIEKKNVEYLIQILRQEITKYNLDKKIIHILVKRCVADGEEYNNVPIGNKCKNFVVDLSFVYLPKIFMQKIEILLENHQISINKTICTNYAKSLLDSDFENLSLAGCNVLMGQNLNEVSTFPRKNIKSSFFERLFHIFS